MLILIISILKLDLFTRLKRRFWEKSDKEKEAEELFIRKEYRKAAEVYQLVIHEENNNKNAISNIATLYYIMGKYDKAIKYSKSIIDLSGKSMLDLFDMIDSYSLLIKILSDNKEFKKAESMLKNYEDCLGYISKKKLKIGDIEKKNYLELKGWLLFNEGKIEEAINLYDEAIPLWKNYFKNTGRKKEYSHQYADLFYHFGIISKHKGEYDKAKEYFEKSIKAGGPESIFSKRSEEEIEKMSREL